MFKNKKVLIATLVVLAVAIVGVGAMIGLKMGKKSVVINPEKIQGLIDAKYEPEIIEENEEMVSLNIVGVLSEEERTNLIKELYEVGSNWGKEKVALNFFTTNEEVKNVDKFYIEGLTTQVHFDYTLSVAKVGTFESIPKVEKAKSVVDYNKGDIAYKDGNLNIKLDMAVEGESVDVVAQAKAFIVMFRDVNKDKDISSVQIDINHNSDTKGYSYNSEYESILKNISIMKF